mmetsp:Transcript_87871/g.188500  ORF Transcript_87871/g.188500 Transcript_87871/m.188500 type:complete len:280 (+) Transcript_87871:732-1571(+)
MYVVMSEVASTEPAGAAATSLLAAGGLSAVRAMSLMGRGASWRHALVATGPGARGMLPALSNDHGLMAEESNATPVGIMLQSSQGPPQSKYSSESSLRRRIFPGGRVNVNDDRQPLPSHATAQGLASALLGKQEGDKGGVCGRAVLASLLNGDFGIRRVRFAFGDPGGAHVSQLRFMRPGEVRQSFLATTSATASASCSAPPQRRVEQLSGQSPSLSVSGQASSSCACTTVFSPASSSSRFAVQAGVAMAPALVAARGTVRRRPLKGNTFASSRISRNA